VDFALSKAQVELQERARDAVERVVVPLVTSRPAGARLGAAEMRQIHKGLASLGYLGSTISPDHGGAGMTMVDYGLLLEAFGTSPVVLTEIVPPRLIYAVGTDEQKRRWLPPLLSGDWIGTTGITEASSGSDTRGFTTSATPVANGYRVTGRKRWILYAAIGDLCTLMTVEPDRKSKDEATRFVVERATTPWTGRDVPSVGMRNLSYGDMEFTDAFVPRENLLGKSGEALRGFGNGILSSRGFVGMNAVGIASHAIDVASRYVRERVAFGRPLAKFQAIQLALAEAAADLAAARLLCLYSLWLLDQGRPASRETSMAKFHATEAAVRACDTAMDVMGAMGLTEEAGVERCWRDVRMLTVIDGTGGIQRLIAGRELLGTQAFL
jgi:alkylation response protein AidB-like acyl-CoA dehydrogenase